MLQAVVRKSTFSKQSHFYILLHYRATVGSQHLREHYCFRPASTMSEATKPEAKRGGKNQGQRGRGGGSAKLRGLPKDSPEVRMSKTLSWVLRHGSQAEGLAMRPDGYVRVDDLVRSVSSLSDAQQYA